ncbi:hypothetical protein Cgig2_013477 [Carnegiea gigantea]|uniref:Pentatricopeptide repeat-containing protein n=1 Tax=Carnegiea gigantea TaxID=171969 RepID=A0A9Q1K3A9_9CARY|nr:hypothetical protein Cgig2_013477 [Carnegiea gigantea]
MDKCYNLHRYPNNSPTTYNVQYYKGKRIVANETRGRPGDTREATMKQVGRGKSGRLWRVERTRVRHTQTMGGPRRGEGRAGKRWLRLGPGTVVAGFDCGGRTAVTGVVTAVGAAKVAGGSMEALQKKKKKKKKNERKKTCRRRKRDGSKLCNILGLCKAWETTRAIDFLADMVSRGCKPIEATYTILIKGIAHEGLAGEASELLNELYARGFLKKSSPERVAMKT